MSTDLQQNLWWAEAGSRQREFCSRPGHLDAGYHRVALANQVSQTGRMRGYAMVCDSGES